jgi:hypothetical protein
MSRLVAGSPPYNQIRTAVVVSLSGIVPLLALLLAARRAAGALAQPLSTSGLLACGLLLAAWAVVVRGLLTSIPSSPRVPQRALAWLPGAILLLAALALLPGASVAGAAVFVALLAAEEAWSWFSPSSVRRALSAWPRLGLPGARSPSAGSARLELPSKPSRLSAAEIVDEGSAARAAENLTAAIVRRREPDGRETLSGSIRAQFAVGQRTAPVHVPFCPPFFEPPRCEAEQVDGPPATVRVAQVLPYGVRFDVKLEGVANRATSVWIEFSVIEQATSEAGRGKAE